MLPEDDWLPIPDGSDYNTNFRRLDQSALSLVVSHLDLSVMELGKEYHSFEWNNEDKGVIHHIGGGHNLK